MKTAPTPRAFHGDPAIKEMFLDRVRKHREMDEIVHGAGYWNGEVGCSVGCSYHCNNHGASEREAEISLTITFAQDRIYENLPKPLDKFWSERFFEAIPVGADLTLVPASLAVWMLTSEDSIYFKFIKDVETTILLMKQGGVLLQKEIDDEPRNLSEWKSWGSRIRSAQVRAHQEYAHLDRLCLDHLALLDRIARLDRLDLLDRIARLCLDRLDRLDFLDRIARLCLDRHLDLLDRLDLLYHLDLLDRLDRRLALLDHIARLDHISRLDFLDRLDPEKKFFVLASEKLLQLMREAPVPAEMALAEK